MKRMLALGGAVVAVLAVWAAPAAAAPYKPDAMLKSGDGPYFTNNLYTKNPIDQQAAASGEAGDVVHFKLKVQNDGNRRDRLKVMSGDHPAFNEKWFRGTNNVTADVWDAGGLKTRRLDTNEFVVLRLRVKIPNDAPTGVSGIVVEVGSKAVPETLDDAVRARVDVVE